jgi:hypothetical protein
MEGGAAPFRPEVKTIEDNVLLSMLQQSWDENPDARPSFTTLKTLFRGTTKGR